MLSKESDREFAAWEAARNAVPAQCRRCFQAAQIAIQGYEEILTLQLPIDEASREIEMRIRTKCGTGLVVLYDRTVCGIEDERAP